jgi:hypothetical protein
LILDGGDHSLCSPVNVSAWCRNYLGGDSGNSEGFCWSESKEFLELLFGPIGIFAVAKNSAPAVGVKFGDFFSRRNKVKESLVFLVAGSVGLVPKLIVLAEEFEWPYYVRSRDVDLGRSQKAER